MQSCVASVSSLARTGDRAKSGHVLAVSRSVNDDALASFAVMIAAQTSNAARPTPRLTPAMRHVAWAEGMRSRGKKGARSIDVAVASAASFGVIPSWL